MGAVYYTLYSLKVCTGVSYLYSLSEYLKEINEVLKQAMAVGISCNRINVCMITYAFIWLVKYSEGMVIPGFMHKILCLIKILTRRHKGDLNSVCFG